MSEKSNFNSLLYAADKVITDIIEYKRQIASTLLKSAGKNC